MSDAIRTVQEIRAMFSKLQAELDTALARVAQLESIVASLENLAQTQSDKIIDRNELIAKLNIQNYRMHKEAVEQEIENAALRDGLQAILGAYDQATEKARAALGQVPGPEVEE